MPALAPHIPAVPASGIRRLFEVAEEIGGEITMLALGEPSVAIAPHIAAAAVEAWELDDTNYAPNGGILPLRQAIQAKLASTNQITAGLDQIWVTVGATQALYQALTATLAAGDEVLIPNPGYTTFTMAPRMLQAVPVGYSLRPELDFMPDFEELERLVTPRTRVLIVNSPSNPLGVVFGASTLRALLAFAKRHDLWVISDEVYEHFTFGSEHVSIASLDDDDRVFTAYSLSKSYAMTGIRVGYLVTPPGFAPTFRTLQEATISCVSVPGQRAGVAAITGPSADLIATREGYRENLRMCTAMLRGRGFEFLQPQGAFYLWVNLSHASEGNVAAWAERFLREHRIAVAPGSAFGTEGEGWIRICLAGSAEALEHCIQSLPVP
ncbi:pyridoxal phosphate-dependent aminotransferase [Humidisolicoccus flavus]|uniref:pyridoxal phosphate-dependent aminotransferase n=1 Tax=Humidisolicoccus flavus TaxID=3111414 RepID=UPI0032517FA2